MFSPGPCVRRFTEPSRGLAVGLVLAAGLLLFVVRLAGPADLTDNDQEGPSAYALDVWQNGHWWVQRDAHGEIASKPPLYPWLAALFSLLAGGLTRLTLYLPCGLAVIGTAWLVLRAGERHFSLTAGFLAAWSLYFCQFGLKHVVLARTDALFMATVALAALAAYRAWTTGRGWTGFWVAAAAASLTKGPLGLGLAAAGLLAAVWERRQGDRLPVRIRLWPGALVYLALVGGVFLLAYAQVGTALTDKQVGRELVGHLSGASAGGHWPGSNPFHPVLYFLSRFAPWSLLTVLGLWRVWRWPAGHHEERRFERFLGCWFFAGLAVFIIAPHKRADLLLPLLPAAALLAGRELARALAHLPPLRLWQGAVAAGALVLAFVPVLARLKPEAPAVTRQTLAMQELASWWQAHAPAGVPLTFAGNAMTLQFYLNRHQFHALPKRAAELLSAAPACYLAVADFGALEPHLPPDGWHVLAGAPVEGSPFVRLLSNRPTLVREPVQAVAVGPVVLELTHAALVQARWLDFTLARSSPGGTVLLVNRSPQAVTVGVLWEGEPHRALRRRLLLSGESWSVPGPEASPAD